MNELREQTKSESAAPPFRIDEKLHQILYTPASKSTVKQEEERELQTLPEPVFPQNQDGKDGKEMTQKEYQKRNAIRTWRSWGSPYFKSRWHRNELRPIIPYLFTEWKCNLDCHYCWSYNNRVKGMTEDTARRSIDWLHSIGSRVLALMGGEPLLRPNFIHKVTYYAAKKDFFVYLPTNGRLMKPDVIDRLGDAGLATVNLAVDSIEDRPELPKALKPIMPYFEYLVKNQRRYGYTIAFNTNITRINMEDVKQLAEIAHDNNIAIDFHINETPMMEQTHFKHLEKNSTYLQPDDWPKVDALMEYLHEKRAAGYKMVNPKQHMDDMLKLMRGEIAPWNCRAGQNSLIIRTDGTLAPCFPMYSATHDWGTVGDHKFDVKQLDEMKKSCSKHCLSTCNYILGYCYDTMRVLGWIAKQARRGFKGVSGSF